MKQTYENYFKDYYERNKERILKNSAEYRRIYAKYYYQKNREKILETKRIKDAERKRNR